MTAYSLDVLLSLFGTSVLFHVQFCCFLTYIHISQEASQVFWYSHLFKNCPQFVVIHLVKGFGIVNKAEIDVFLELSCFFDDPQMLAIWSLVPLPFLNPSWTSGSSLFMYCWGLAWRIWSIALPACGDRMISVLFQGKPFIITVIQVYALTSNVEEDEVEWLYEDTIRISKTNTQKKMSFSL